MSKTVAMVEYDTGKTADVHPAEVENWKASGWREAEAMKAADKIEADGSKKRRGRPPKAKPAETEE